MAKKVISREARDARKLGLALLAGLLFFPTIKLLFKAVEFIQFIIFGYVQ